MTKHHDILEVDKKNLSNHTNPLPLSDAVRKQKKLI